MGPDVYSKSDEDLCCPVCRQPLSNPGSPPKPKQKIGKYKPPLIPSNNSHSHKEKTNRVPKASVKDSDDVVVSNCGHLFHKFCLRHYCYLYREGRLNHLSRVTCPICKRSISMSSAQTILYKEHQDAITESDREGTKTSLMNNELSDQMKTAKTKLQNLTKCRQDVKQNVNIYRSHWKKLKKELKKVRGKKVSVDALYADIQHTDKMLAFMQTQHLKIVRKFINKVKQKTPKDFIHFPRRLAPYLTIIEKDDRLVRDLGEVIMPIHLNHLKSDRQSLLKGIIEFVMEKAKETYRENEEIINKKLIEDKKKKHKPQVESAKVNPLLKTTPNLKRPPIFVKVRKSSVSILSTTSLTKEKIKKIIETVQANGPVGTLKKELAQKCHHADNPKHKISASDIKIIYMPKKKMIVPVSEPCRVIEATDSFLIKIPPRRCRSTNAILMKNKRRRRRGPLKEIDEVNEAGDIQLIQKRSKSAEPDLRLINQEKQKSRRCSKKPSSVIAVVSLPNPKEDGKEEKSKEEKKHKENGKSKSKEEEKLVKEKEISITAKTKVAPQPKTQRDENNNILELTEAKEHLPCPELETLPEEELKSSKNVKKGVSVLQMIYDDLKEEQITKHQFDEMNNNCLKESDDEAPPPPPPQQTETQAIEKEPHPPENRSRSEHEEELFRPPPKFFRIDQKGNVRPESPYRMCFRQPTFLSSIADMINERTIFMAGCTEPDVENQLDALSPEDRYLLAAEHESIGLGKGEIRPQMYFGLPACLGVPPQDSSTSSFQPEINTNTTPVYLKRWQQQLPSKNIFKIVSKQKTTSPIAHCRSARIDNRRSTPSQYRQRNRISLPQKIFLQNRRESVRLPPLYMYPAKRPSTADCIRAKMEESTTFPFCRRRFKTLPKIYDSSNNKPSSMSFIDSRRGIK